MNNLAFASIATLRTLLAEKKISHEELLRFFVKRAQEYNQKLNAFCEVFDEEELVKQVRSQGIFSGIPGAIKNNICIKGKITTAGSKILHNYRAAYDATGIDRLKNAGASFLGTANLDEFAMGSSTETSAFGITKNPWNLTCVPGGPSGG